MSREQLTRAIHDQAFVAALKDTEALLIDPPQRSTRPEVVELRDWFGALSDTDSAHVREIIKIATEYAVFGMLCLLDNVRPVAKGFTQELALGIESEGRIHELPGDEFLHDIFRDLLRRGGPDESELAQSAVEADPDRTAADREGLRQTDLHHVPQRHAAAQVIEGYDSSTAPAISLPRGEHHAIPQIHGTFDGTPQELIAQDLRDLRKYTQVPDRAVTALIDLIRTTYPGILFDPDVGE